MASAYMFSHYWPGDGLEGEVPVVATISNYPWWFDGSTLGSGLVFPTVPRRVRKQLKGWWIQHVWRRVPTRLIASWFALRAIWGPDWAEADRTVREVARDPASRNLSTWGAIARLEVSNAAHGENMYRNFSARLRLGKGAESGVLTELAYLGLKKRGR